MNRGVSSVPNPFRCCANVRFVWSFIIDINDERSQKFREGVSQNRGWIREIMIRFTIQNSKDEDENRVFVAGSNVEKMSIIIQDLAGAIVCFEGK